MALSTLKRWLGLAGEKPCRIRPRPTFKLKFDQLEDRLAPATVTWVGAAGATWSVAANWSPAQVPVNGDTVVFEVPLRLEALTPILR